jgi:hypothetical protein
MSIKRVFLALFCLGCWAVMPAQDCDYGCFYNDSWIDDAWNYGSTVVASTQTSFDVYLTLTSPGGRIATSESYCTTSDAVDSYLPMLGEFGDYILNLDSRMYYQLSGYSGCWGTPAQLLPQILTGTLAWARTYYKDPTQFTVLGVPVPGYYTYQNLACEAPSSPKCVDGIGFYIPPRPDYAYADYLRYSVKFLGVTIRDECVLIPVVQPAAGYGPCY